MSGITYLSRFCCFHHAVMFFPVSNLLSLFIFFQYSSQIMRSLCQDECEADVNIMRSLCQGECEADVKTNAKPMSSWMRSRCQDECGADVNIMRSLCQGEYEADAKTNAKPMSRRPRSRYREGTHTHTRRMEVHTHTNKLTPNGNTQWDMFYFCLQWLLGFLLSR